VPHLLRSGKAALQLLVRDIVFTIQDPLRYACEMSPRWPLLPASTINKGRPAAWAAATCPRIRDGIPMSAFGASGLAARCLFRWNELTVHHSTWRQRSIRIVANQKAGMVLVRAVLRPRLKVE
jgi:hypothetical protein